VSNFVFASSAAVYGDCKTLPIREDYQLKPLSPYGASKVEAERIVLSYDNSKIENAISLRFFNVYGKGQTPEYAGVITKFAERIKRNLPPIIYGDGAQSRDFVAVDDVVKAIILALTVPPQKMEQTISGRVYNVGTGVSCTIKDLALTMTRALKRDLQPIFLEQKEGDIKHSCAETTKSKEDLGFIAKVNLYSGLKQIMPDL
jgi:UDP-glucose 4-epimerase